MTTKQSFVWLARFSVVGLLASCAFTPDEAHLYPEKSRKAAPEFSLKDSDGKLVKLSDYRGKVVLLNFWATWCGPCQEELPWFREFQRDYKDRNFAVLGLSVDEEGWKAITPFLTHFTLNYPILLADDHTQMVYGNVEMLPTNFVIDAQGRIASHHIGLVSKKTYREEILGLLETPTHVSKNTGGPAASGLLAFLRTTR